MNRLKHKTTTFFNDLPDFIRWYLFGISMPDKNSPNVCTPMQVRKVTPEKLNFF